MERFWKDLFVIVSAAGLAAIFTWIFFGTSNYDSEEVIATAQKTASDVSPQLKTITIGTISDKPVKIITRYQPTADYIASKLSTADVSYSGKVVVAKDRAEMIELIKNKKMDLYYDSPFISITVNDEAGASPELTRWKEGVYEYHSVFVVRKDSSFQMLEDLRGATMAFEDRFSSSGYLLPASYLILSGFDLKKADLNSEESTEDTASISYTFSGDDENTYYMLAERKVDAAAMSNIDFLQAPEAVRNEFRIIDQTFDVPRHFVSFGAHLDSETAQKIKSILLAMESDPEGAYVMSEFESTTRYSEIRDRANLLDRIHKMLEVLQ